MEIKPNFIDNVVGIFSPRAMASRLKFRYAAGLIQEQSRKYEGASRGRRTSGWNATSSSATTEIHTALTTLRNRSRDLSRNNPYAKNAIREIANNVVGTGIIPKPVGLGTREDKYIKQTFKAWAESSDCDYDGHLNFYGLQSLAMRTIAESGEVIIRKHIRKGLAFPLQLQVLEPDFIDTTRHSLQTQTDGSYILYGIEFSKEHKVIAFWLWDSHPGDSLQYATKSSRIPATEIIHVFEKDRPGQFRGVPMAHSSMLRMRDLDEFEDAQLIRQKIAACFSVFVTDSDQPASINGTKDAPVPLEKVEPGIIEYLAPGKQVTMASPPDAGASYDPYIKSNLRAIACGYGMDYVTLTGDLTDVNFSSGRMGWLKVHRNVSAWQWNMMVPMMLNKAWDWFTQVANVMGIIKVEKVLVTWTPPRREMIDPVKEVEGVTAAIRAGLTSLPAAIRENGDDPDEVFDEIQQTNAKLDAKGLVFSSDARKDLQPKPAATNKPADSKED